MESGEGVELWGVGVPSVAGATPVEDIKAIADVAVEGGEGPEVGAGDVFVFDRIVGDVVEVVVVIGFVADEVFPEAGLPDAAAAGAEAVSGACVFGLRGGVEDGPGKFGLEVGDAGGVVGIVLRECHEDVEVFGQEDHGINGERARLARDGDRGMQHPPIARVGEEGRTLIGNDCEEERPAGLVGATVGGHEAER